MILNELWIITEKVRLELPLHYKNCIIDEYCFMPDHFHWIIIIEKKINIFKYDYQNKKIHWLSEIIRWFKTYSSKFINHHLKHNGFAWQRSFHDYIIKTESMLKNALLTKITLHFHCIWCTYHIYPYIAPLYILIYFFLICSTLLFPHQYYIHEQTTLPYR